MTPNAQSRADAALGNAPSAGRPRRFGWVVAVVILLLLLLGGGAGGVWWATHGGAAPTVRKAPGDNPVDKPSLCSDDDDPKYLIHLEYGTPIEPGFDRRRLDALAGRPIPEVEQYPWQPKELIAVLGEHRMRGQLVAASPDGRLLAVGSPGDGTIRIGATETVHEKALFVCPAGPVAMAWAPGGEALTISCGDGTVRLYDVRDLDKIPDPTSLEKATATVTSLSYSADGKHLLGGDVTLKKGMAWVWEVGTRKIVNRLQHIGPVLKVAFSPVPGDHRALTAGGVADGRLHLWKDAVAGGIDDQTVIDFKPSKYDETTFVNDVAFSPDGTRAVSSHSDSKVRLWDLSRFEKDKELFAIPHQANSAPLVAYSPDGRYLATTRLTADGVWLWSAKDGTAVRQAASSSGVNSLRFLSGEHLLFTGTFGRDWNVHIHDVETGKEQRPPIGHLTGLSCVALSPDGQRVASGGGDLQVRLWDLEKPEERHAVSAGDLWSVNFHPDSKRVFYCGSSLTTLPLVDFESGQLQTPAYNNQHSGAVYSAAITRDGRYAVTGGYQDGTVRMWRLRDGVQVRFFNDFGPKVGSAAVTLSPDMRRAVLAGADRTRLLQLRCGEVRYAWDKPTIWAPFLPDAQVAFFGGATAPVWQVAGDETKETRQIGLNLTGMGAAALSGDAGRVAVLLGSKVAVYNVETTTLVWEWTPPAHFGGVRGVALSFDGRDLLTANGDGTAYVIQIP